MLVSNHALRCCLGGLHIERLVCPLFHNSWGEYLWSLDASVWFAICIHLEDPLVSLNLHLPFTTLYIRGSLLQFLQSYQTLPLLRKQVLCLAKPIERSSTNYPCWWKFSSSDCFNIVYVCTFTVGKYTWQHVFNCMLHICFGIIHFLIFNTFGVWLVKVPFAIKFWVCMLTQWCAILHLFLFPFM